MPDVLYIQASPRGERSRSIRVCDTFLKAWKATKPDVEVKTLNVFDMDLPQFDGPMLEAKYNIMHGRDHTEEQREDWARIEALMEEFQAADAYVFAVPMWNYMIPYRLKQYIDCITQPTYTFTIVDGEYQGLCDGRVFVGYARGNAYPEGAPRHAFNLQSPYFEMWLGFVGLTDVTTVAAEATLAPPETADAALQQALRQADEAGRGF